MVKLHVFQVKWLNVTESQEIWSQICIRKKEIHGTSRTVNLVNVKWHGLIEKFTVFVYLGAYGKAKACYKEFKNIPLL